MRSSQEPRRYTRRSTLRHAVATEAARLLYRREFKEYYQAKREAAKRQGCTVLPTNSEIHQQLLLIAERTEGAERTLRLGDMRLVAAELMELLEPFHPRLIGSTWTGHIRDGSDIDLNLFYDDLEAILEVLDRKGLSYRIERVRSRHKQQEREFIHVKLKHRSGFDVEITVYPESDLREHPKCSITGGPMKRATLPELKQKLQQEHKGHDQPRPQVRPNELQQLLEPPQLEQLLPLLPEVTACQDVQQNHYHHLDVFEHTLEVVRGLQELDLESLHGDLPAHMDSPGPGGWSRRALLHLAALCHDIGKPQTWSLHRSGRIRFLGHESVGAGMARNIALRLEQPPALGQALERLVVLHMEPMLLPTHDDPPSRLYRLFREARDLMPELMLLSLADAGAARGPAQPATRQAEQRRFVEEMLEEYFESGFLRFPTTPVSPVDLEYELGITDPVMRARLLERLTEDYVDGEIEGREDGLMWASELLELPMSRW